MKRCLIAALAFAACSVFADTEAERTFRGIALVDPDARVRSAAAGSLWPAGKAAEPALIAKASRK